jgi:hypothetical protein
VPEQGRLSLVCDRAPTRPDPPPPTPSPRAYAPTSQINEQFPNRTSRRVMHGSIQVVSIAFAAMGVMVVIAMHTQLGRSNLGGGDVTQAFTVHAWMGYVAAFLLLAQVCVCLRVCVCVRSLVGTCAPARVTCAWPGCPSVVSVGGGAGPRMLRVRACLGLRRTLFPS